MGYEIFWTIKKYDDATFDKAVEMIRIVIDHRHKIDEKKWGICFDAGHENFCIQRNPLEGTYGSCKTRGRFPYTGDVMKALIVMVECGMAKEAGHNLEDNSLWLASLEMVSEQMEMKTYSAQKAYFKREPPLAIGS